MRRTSWRAEKLLASERSYAIFEECVLKEDFYKWKLIIYFSWCSILWMSLHSYDSRCERLNGLHRDEWRRVTVCRDRSVPQNSEFLVASASINHWSNSVPRGLWLWAPIRTRLDSVVNQWKTLDMGCGLSVSESRDGQEAIVGYDHVFSPIPCAFSSVRMTAMKEEGGGGVVIPAIFSEVIRSAHTCTGVFIGRTLPRHNYWRSYSQISTQGSCHTNGISPDITHKGLVICEVVGFLTRRLAASWCLRRWGWGGW